MKPHTNNNGNDSTVLPIIALLSAQLFTSSWHVLGKHVMHQVPYLAPISYVLIRTLISCIALLIVGIMHEGYMPFPSLFLNGTSMGRRDYSSSSSIDNNMGLPISCPNSGSSFLNQNGSSMYRVDGDHPTHSPTHSPVLKVQSKDNSNRHGHGHRHRHRRRKRNSSNSSRRFSLYVPSIYTLMHTAQYYQKQIRMNNMNPEAIQIIVAGLSGMFLLPTCYTTGLILTSPTVASVYDGPMIPLGCFLAAVTLGLEQRSKTHPNSQIFSLLLTVSGSIVVLLVDYLGGGHGMDHHHVKAVPSSADNHVQFIRGNMVLAGIVAAYSATALLQKRLNHYPPLQLTAWMFGVGNIGCFTLLLVDSLLGGILTGCTLGQALIQLYAALTTSPTFRLGLLYSAFFVGGACFSIGSYAASHLESSVITLFAAAQPPITAVLEFIWEGKELGWKKLIGMICVGLGMYFFTYIKRIEKKQSSNKSNQHPKKAQSSDNVELTSFGNVNDKHRHVKTLADI